MRKKIVLLGVALLSVLVFALAGCSGPRHEGDGWKKKGFDLSINLENAGQGAENANSEGWYMTMSDDFTGTGLNDTTWVDGGLPEGGIWTTSPHDVRYQSQINKKNGKVDWDMTDDERDINYTSYWCPNQVQVRNGNVEVMSYQTTNHDCDICPKVGRFTGGFETRAVELGADNKGKADKILWDQAFGYFEASVKFPKATGLWSAMWLQSSNMRMVGNEGEDGTEIDIYESAFGHYNEAGVYSYMGHALLWDGYGKSGKVDDYIGRTDKQGLQNPDLYDGYHTFGLKWTPEYYVFYIDGVPTYATNAGKVSKVAEFLRFTVEMDAGDKNGPHGMKIGAFDKDAEPAIFYVDYVKVYQNKNYTQYEKKPSEYQGIYDGAN